MVRDLGLGGGSDRHALVTLHGKGRKRRQCPLWPRTKGVLAELVKGRSADDSVFLSRYHRPYTRCTKLNTKTSINAMIRLGFRPFPASRHACQNLRNKARKNSPVRSLRVNCRVCCLIMKQSAFCRGKQPFGQMPRLRQAFRE